MVSIKRSLLLGMALWWNSVVNQLSLDTVLDLPLVKGHVSINKPPQNDISFNSHQSPQKIRASENSKNHFHESSEESQDIEIPKETRFFDSPRDFQSFEKPQEIRSFESSNEVFSFESPKQVQKFEKPRDNSFMESSEIPSFQSSLEFKPFEIQQEIQTFETPQEIPSFETSLKFTTFDKPQENFPLENIQKSLSAEKPQENLAFKKVQVSSPKKPQENPNFEKIQEIQPIEKQKEYFSSELPQDTFPINRPQENQHFDNQQESRFFETQEENQPLGNQQNQPLENQQENQPLENQQQNQPLENQQQNQPFENQQENQPFEIHQEKFQFEKIQETLPFENNQENIPSEFSQEIISFEKPQENISVNKQEKPSFEKPQEMKSNHAIQLVNESISFEPEQEVDSIKPAPVLHNDNQFNQSPLVKQPEKNSASIQTEPIMLGKSVVHSQSKPIIKGDKDLKTIKLSEKNLVTYPKQLDQPKLSPTQAVFKHSPPYKLQQDFQKSDPILNNKPSPTESSVKPTNSNTIPFLNRNFISPNSSSIPLSTYTSSILSTSSASVENSKFYTKSREFSSISRSDDNSHITALLPNSYFPSLLVIVCLFI